MPALSPTQGATATAETRVAAWPGATLGQARGVRFALGLSLLAALYAGAAHLGYALSFSGPVAAMVWLPAGVGIAFLFLAGPRYWPGVLAGDLLANVYTTVPLGAAIGQTTGNVLEVVTATLILRRLVRRGSPVDSITGVGAMLVAILAGCAVSAIIGPLSLWAGGVLDAGELAHVSLTWWLGDSAGAIVVVPLVLAWAAPMPWPPAARRVAEAVVTLAAVGGVALLALGTDRPLAYLVFPGLIWSALRLGPRGATAAVAITCAVSLWATTHYVGPFVYQSIGRSVLSTQLFIAVSALTTVCLAAVVSEARRASRQLDESRARVVAAADAERLRISHNLHDGAQQRLTALTVRLGLAADRAREHPADAVRDLDAATVEVQLAIDELRDLAHGVHPAALVGLGLAAALKSLALRSPLSLDLADLPPGRLDETAEATAYYVVAEAVTNAQKHAGPAHIAVHVGLRDGVLDVVVADDGRGGAVERAGSGLEGLRDRVEAVGGRFAVGAAAGGGTRVRAAIPAAARLAPA